MTPGQNRYILALAYSEYNSTKYRVHDNYSSELAIHAGVSRRFIEYRLQSTQITFINPASSELVSQGKVCYKSTMVKELKIILNGPPNQAYTPGSEVSGRLVVEVDGQPKSYHYIQVSLFGRAHVEFNQQRITYDQYTSDEVYANVTLQLWSKEQSPDQKLHPGLYHFPFRFNSLFCATGPLFTLTVQIPRTGYCVGEEIPLNVEIENGSSRHFRLNATLHKWIVYTAQATTIHMTQFTRELLHSETVVGVKSHQFPPGTTTTWNPTELKIPPTETTMTSCRIINISYFLEVTAVIARSRNLPLVIPITIGNDLPAPFASFPRPMTSQQAPQQFRAFPPHPGADVHPPSYEEAVGINH